MQFTGFTGTKVQILTHSGQGKELLACVQRDGPDEEPFAIGTHFCLLYWYRSANTDAGGAAQPSTTSISSTVCGY
jgi:hypothetical protein